MASGQEVLSPHLIYSRKGERGAGQLGKMFVMVPNLLPHGYSTELGLLGVKASEARRRL